MRKKIVTLILTMILSAAVPAMNVYADREDDLRAEQEATNQQLNNTYAQIDNLYAQKQQLENEINSLDANLVSVMVSIQTLEGDISNKTTAITKTEENITKAKNAKKKQYEAMKKRIQYLYEKGGDTAWFQMMMNSDSLTDLLNNAEYTQKMYKYDRDCLDKYANTITEIQKLEDRYQQEKAELEGMKQEQEAEQANLQAAIDSKRASSADCDNEIAYAQQMANEYASLIQQQQAEIEQIQAEKEAARIEAERQAEAERLAAEQAAAEEAARQEAEKDESVNEPEDEYDDYDETEDDKENESWDEPSDEGIISDDDFDEWTGSMDDEQSTDSDDSGDSERETDEDGYIIDGGNLDDELESMDSGSESGSENYSGSSSGSSVVDYATQFVGNPYVWGGTSLTNGADCSGFVQSVYSKFGVDLPRTSYEQQNTGKEVSYADAQPGDLICYGGHVAIYMGNGQIVHASNSRDGIKISDNAAYRTILSVRRLV